MVESLDKLLDNLERDIFVTDIRLQHAETVVYGGLERLAILRTVGALQDVELGVDAAQADFATENY